MSQKNQTSHTPSLPEPLTPADSPPIGGKAHDKVTVWKGEARMLLQRDVFEQAWSVAVLYSKADLLPKHFFNKPNNCFIALEIAMRLKMNPMAVMQSCYVVSGRPSFEGKFVIGVVNSSGRFVDPLEFDFSGTKPTRKDLRSNSYDDADWTCTVTAQRVKRDGKGKVCSLDFEWGSAVDEGWVKGNPHWRQIPEQMMIYRAAAFFARAYCPELLMGFSTKDELDDMVAVEPKNVTSTALGTAGLKERLLSNGSDGAVGPVQADPSTDAAAGGEGHSADEHQPEPSAEVRTMPHDPNVSNDPVAKSDAIEVSKARITELIAIVYPTSYKGYGLKRNQLGKVVLMEGWQSKAIPLDALAACGRVLEKMVQRRVEEGSEPPANIAEMQDWVTAAREDSSNE